MSTQSEITSNRSTQSEITSKPETIDLKHYPTPTGLQLSCKGWVQEAALRMLLNNLDPDVAERPEELIVYGEGERLPVILNHFDSFWMHCAT